jgi:4-hydroxybenzoyl-CoA reductase subunit beta
MMRLPPFRFHAPSEISEAAKILSESGPDAALLAGGTDLLPNMKRGQQNPATLIGLSRIDALRRISNGSGISLGAGVSLTSLVENKRVKEQYRGLWQAAGLVATPQLRNMGTLGGNICLDTRCDFYNRSEEWRKSINYCLKKDGDTCWVVTQSKKCRAVSSTDTAPALVALGARVRLTSCEGDRLARLEDFYLDDGIDYIDLKPGEILTEIQLDPSDGWRSTYWKLRRRGSFDFPALSVAAAVQCDGGGLIEAIRVVLGAVDSRPLVSTETQDFLVGRSLTDEIIEEAGRIASKQAKPVNNTDFEPLWRKKMIPVFVGYALRELRGDDVSELRKRVGHQARN